MSQSLPIGATSRIAGPYTAAAGQTVFTFPFVALASADLLVQVATAAAPTTWVTVNLTADYSVSGVGAPAGGGAVTFLAGRAVGSKVLITGLAPINSTYDASPAGKFDTKQINRWFDRFTIWSQEARRDLIALFSTTAAHEDHLKTVDTLLSAVDEHLITVDGRLDNADTNFNAVDGRLDTAETRLNADDIRTAALGSRIGRLENNADGGPGLTGRPIFGYAENQSNGALEDADPAYNWPPNLFIWEWDGLVHPDTFIGTKFFQPQIGITKVRYARDAMARVARANPRSPVYLVDISVGGQYLAQFRLTYPAAPYNPPGTVPGGPVVGGGAMVGGLAYYNMRKIRDNNMPVALAAAGVSTIDYYLMWQGENEANIQNLPFVPFLTQRNEHHTTLRSYAWFPYETPFIQMTMCPYAYALNNYNRLLKAWVMREPQTRIIGDSTFIPSAQWPDNLHIQGAPARKMAGGAAYAAMMGRAPIATAEQRVPLMVAGANVDSVINGLSQYTYDGQCVTEHGRFYLIPEAGGGTLTTITLPFEYEFSIANPSWDVTATAYDGTTQTTLPVTVVQTSTSAALVVFKPTTTNLWTISYSGGGRFSNV